MKKRIITISLVAALLATCFAGTYAYLMDTDEVKNTMTLGSVEINQTEWERVVEDGNWVLTGETDKYGYTPEKIQPFTQDKPLNPAVFADGMIKYDDRATNGNGGEHQQSWGQIGAPGSNRLFDDSVKNVIDKFVFVTNTGKNDAYVRTIVALEQGNIEADDFENVIMTNSDAKGQENNYQGHWEKETAATDVVIGGTEYYIFVFTYCGPTSNPTGILAPGTASYPSLLQVYMKPEATNDDVAAIDGNANGKYDILVLSQAVQAAGFDNAATALDTAFGDVTATTAAEWLAKVQ
jgi:hypothetical protein